MNLILMEFFDRVNLDYLGNILHKLGIPLNLVLNMISWSRTKPRNSDNPTSLTWDSAEEKLLSINLNQQSNLPKNIKPKEGWEIEKNNYGYYHGLAQGSPLSPTLSTIILVPLIMLTTKAIALFYADDGILVPKKGINPIDILKNIDPDSGIKAHIERPKSG